MNLSETETALVLTGLRILQEEMQHNFARVERFPQIQEIDYAAVSLEDIDELCERINCAEPCKPIQKKTAKRETIINSIQELYSIPEGTGYVALGFDVCLKRIKGYAAELGLDADPANMERGSLAAYQYYKSLTHALYERHRKTGQLCNAELTPQLIDLEGKRVEVVDCHGNKRSFWVGKSTGWIPIHLELKLRTSSGGGAVTGAPFKSVRILEEHR